MDWLGPPHVAVPTPPQLVLPIHGRTTGAVALQAQIPALALISIPEPHEPIFHVSAPDVTEVVVPARSAVAINCTFGASQVVRPLPTLPTSWTQVYFVGCRLARNVSQFVH